MIIAITRDNESLIKNVCDNLNEDVQIISGITNIRKFVIQEIKNLNNYTNIVIDLIGLNDTEEELVDAIVALKSMYNIKIIILAIGYDEKEPLLVKIFSDGIYNIVTTTDIKEQEKDLLFCLKVGKQYMDSVDLTMALSTNSDDEIVIKKEYKKVKQQVTIGIAGTQSHIGTTTHALAITKFLNDLNMYACYIQANKSNDIETLATGSGLEFKEDLFSYEGIDIYCNDKRVKDIKYGYDFYIYDMGVLSGLEDINKFLSKDIKIIISGSKSWEKNNLMKVIENFKKSDDINYLVNFTGGTQTNKVRAEKEKLGVKIFFLEYMFNLLDIKSNEDTYHKIFKDYIVEKAVLTEVVSNSNKKGIFNKLKSFGFQKT